MIRQRAVAGCYSEIVRHARQALLPLNLIVLAVLGMGCMSSSQSDVDGKASLWPRPVCRSKDLARAKPAAEMRKELERRQIGFAIVRDRLTGPYGYSFGSKGDCSFELGKAIVVTGLCADAMRLGPNDEVVVWGRGIGDLTLNRDLAALGLQNRALVQPLGYCFPAQ
jgi:hypothetical protein